MASFTMPEEVLGIPLWVPSQYNYFQVEEDAMPNGDPCLVVNGAVSDQYKAFMAAPTLSPDDIFNTGEPNPSEWSMSCWLKLSALSVSGSGDIMLGVSTKASNGVFADDRNLGHPILFGPAGTTGYQFFREVRNNIASPTSARAVLVTGELITFLDYWFLFVFNLTNTGTVTGAVYLDTYVDAQASDTASTGIAGSAFLSGRYLHLGAYHNGGAGRADQWRIGKWAFHDHALTAAERSSMWHEMYGAGPFVYTDDANRASLGNLWRVIPSWSAFAIASDQFQTTSALRRMYYGRDLGSPNTYAELTTVNHPSLSRCLLILRARPFAGSVFYEGGYSSQDGAWTITRSGTTIATAATPDPTPPYRVRFEAETNGSNNVDLRVYEIVSGSPTLRLSFTDTDANRILTGRNAGIALGGGGAGQDQFADDFECGTL